MLRQLVVVIVASRSCWRKAARVVLRCASNKSLPEGKLVSMDADTYRSLDYHIGSSSGPGDVRHGAPGEMSLAAELNGWARSKRTSIDGLPRWRMPAEARGSHLRRFA